MEGSMKVRIVSNTEKEKLESSLEAILCTIDNMSDFTVQYSTCAFGQNGVIMYSAIIVWN